jgi:hypothetical protein
MARFSVETPDGPERGIRVGCVDHDEWVVFQPGVRKGRFYCAGCGYEIAVDVRDTHDWRDLGEMC